MLGITDRKPVPHFTIREHGFYGDLFQPERDRYPGKAMIVLGGSGGYHFTKKAADSFRKAGMTALSVAYYGKSVLPAILKEVPVELIHKAAAWIRDSLHAEAGIWGISYGGTLALLAASLRPDLFSCVVAAGPFPAVPQAMGLTTTMKTSAFSYQGNLLPYLPYTLEPAAYTYHIRKSLLSHREPYSTDVISEAMDNRKNDDSLIRIEQIRAPILLISASHDTVSPAKKTCRMYFDRLKKAKHPYSFAHYSFGVASHNLFPFRSAIRELFRIERHWKELCDNSRARAWSKTLTFLREQWNPDRTAGQELYGMEI